MAEWFQSALQASAISSTFTGTAAELRLPPRPSRGSHGVMARAVDGETRGSAGVAVVDDAMGALLERRGAEVDEETYRQVEEAELGQDLLAVEREPLRDRLDLDHDAAFDQSA